MKEDIDVKKGLNYNLSEAYLELVWTSDRAFFVKIANN